MRWENGKMALRRHYAFFAVLSVSERAGYPPGFADDITWDFISNVNCITRNATLFSALESMKFADFATWSGGALYRNDQDGAHPGGNDNFKGTYAVKNWANG